VRDAFEDEWQGHKIGLFHHRSDWTKVEVADLDGSDTDLLKSIRL